MTAVSRFPIRHSPDYGELARGIARALYLAMMNDALSSLLWSIQSTAYHAATRTTSSDRAIIFDIVHYVPAWIWEPRLVHSLSPHGGMEFRGGR